MTDPTGTDLVFAKASLEERYRWAQAISNAGDLVPKGFRDRNGNANASKVLLAAETGAMLGVHPIAALNGIHVIEGKPTISPGLMSGLVRKAGHKLRVTTKGSVRDKTFTATAVLIRADDPDFQYSSTWDYERAERAGLVGKDTWKRYFEAMAKARAIGDVVREGAEDVLMGASHTAEEFDAPVNEIGEVIEDAEIIEQDHDGPNVTRTMRESSRPTGPSPEEEQAAADEFKARGDRAQTTDELNTIWAEAKRRGLLPNVTTAGTHLGDELLDRGRALKDAAAQAAAGEPETPPVDDETTEVEYESDVPF